MGRAGDGKLAFAWSLRIRGNSGASDGNDGVHDFDWVSVFGMSEGAGWDTESQDDLVGCYSRI